jgi:hypothetical protein
MEKYIDQFLDDNLDIEITFNEYDTFFNLLNRRGLINRIQDYKGDNLHYFLIWLYNNDISEFRRKIVDFLNGDLIIDEDGNIFLDINDISDLSYLFCKNSRISNRETVRNILSGDFDSDVHGGYSATDDVYRDVIRNLNPKNYAILRKYIVDNLKDVQIFTPDDEFEFIDDSNVDKVIRDEDIMNGLLDNELYELNSSLYSLYDSAHGSALIDEYREDIFKELDEYFSGYGQYITIPSKYSTSGTQERFRIPVSTRFNSTMVDYLIGTKNYGGSDRIDYFGSYLDLLDSNMDCLTVEWSPFPNSSEVDEMVNELFTDYI